MTISRRAFLTGGAKGAAALFVAPAIIKIDHLMKPVMPPEPKIITDPNAFNFMVQGLVPGTRVALFDEITGEALYQGYAKSSVIRTNVPIRDGSPVIVRARKPGFKAFDVRTGLPYEGGKTKVVVQMPKDLIYA